MKLCAERIDEDMLDDIRKRIKTGKNATLTRWEALRLLLHIEHQEELLEARMVDRDILRDELDVVRNTIAS
jgi:hypothetical protein